MRAAAGLLGALLLGGGSAALLMLLSMPLSVTTRARLKRPNITIAIDLPYSPTDLFYELLNPHDPLGASGSFSVDRWELVETADGV